VISFEGDRHHALRLLRALKHRFGATDELGLMQMTEEGLVSVADPSALFLADRRVGGAGSVVTCVLEGSRPLCVEAQALVASDKSAAIARRIAQAIDGGRLSMLTAVLDAHTGIALKENDVYASIAGGVRVAGPGADLAIAVAVASSHMKRAIEPDTVVIGEVGLGGEVRQVAHAPRLIAEAMRCGFRRAIVPASTPDVRGVALERVADLAQALVATGCSSL
jgi:DNA repair protein RadA/Sms